MATAPKTKPTARAKPSVVPAKKIANAAAKVPLEAGKSSATKKSAATVVAKPAKANKASKPTKLSKASAPAKVVVDAKSVKAGSKKSTPTADANALKDKAKKAKLVRDSFTMPEAEYAVLGEVKKTCLAAGIEVKKSQLLRIGLVLLSKTELPALKVLIEALAPLKAGRPKAM